MPPRDPLRVAREELGEGLALVRQDAPAGSRAVALSYIGPGGTAYDPQGSEGLALVAGELAVVAAGRRDRRALARRLDALGATLGQSPSPECLEITAWGPAEHWEALLDLLADAVLRPRYAAEDVALARRQLREQQLRERTQPDLRAETELLRALFPKGHPYRRSGLGDARSLRRIDPTALRAFHRAHYVAEGAAVVVTSDRPSEELRAAVARRFLGEGLAGAPPRPAMPVVSAPRPARRQVPLPRRAQTEVRLAAVGVARSDPRYPALYLANEVLGGQAFLSRLLRRVREEEGLAYHASSELEAMGWGGLWEVQAGTGPERADAVEAALRREFARLRETAIPRAELDRVRESDIGSLALDIETTQRAHDLALTSAYYRLPEDFYRTWPGRLRAVTPEEIRAAVAATVPEAALAVVRVGPP